MLAEAGGRVWRRAVDAPVLVRGLICWIPGMLIGLLGVLFLLVPMRAEWSQGRELEAAQLGQLSNDWQEYVRLRAIDQGFRESEPVSILQASTTLHATWTLATSMKWLVSLAEESGMRLENLRPQAQAAETGQASHAFAIRLVGRFEELLDFLERLAALSVAVGVVEFTIEASPSMDALTFEALLKLAAKENR